MQRLEVSGAVRPLYWSSGVKGLKFWERAASELVFPTTKGKCGPAE